MATMQRRLAAIVHADLAGFTRMMEGAETRISSGSRRRLAARDQAGCGRLIGTARDATLREFGSAVLAVSVAIDIRSTWRLNPSAKPAQAVSPG
jgi:class 3 adenylate cyclase